ncbi:hypothetical protein ACFL3C_04585 [Patescibacteria group bacterium]
MKVKMGQPGEATPEGYTRVVVGAVKERMNFRVLDTLRSSYGDEFWITFPDEVEANLRMDVGNTQDLVNQTLFVKFPYGVNPPPEK